MARSVTYEEFCRWFVREPPMAEAVGERYYFVPPDVAAFKSGEQRKPYARGLPLGMGDRSFAPSAALLTILAEQSDVKAVVSDPHTQWLFLCGRDVFSGMFTCTRGTGFVLVQNERDENLGLGELVPGERGVLLRNVLDRGNYLRHEPVSLESRTPRKKVGAPRKHHSGRRF